MVTFSALLVCAALGAGSLVAGPVEVVADGFQFTEGPIWTKDGLIFSDIPADAIVRADKSAVYKPSGKSNGLTLDGAGLLVRCEGGNRRVVRIEADGAMKVLATKYDGKKLNSPNDVVVHKNGTIYFTDPTYGLEGRTQEQTVEGVYALAPFGAPKLIASDFKKPNGIALSPDGTKLYVADTEGNHIRTFDIAKDGTTSGGAVLCELPNPDGIRVDTEGRIWATSNDGVIVFDAAGQKLETIKIPQIPANCGFGGPDGKTLYVTARTAVYSVKTNATGLVGAWKR